MWRIQNEETYQTNKCDVQTLSLMSCNLVHKASSQTSYTDLELTRTTRPLLLIFFPPLHHCMKPTISPPKKYYLIKMTDFRCSFFRLCCMQNIPCTLHICQITETGRRKLFGHKEKLIQKQELLAVEPHLISPCET